MIKPEELMHYYDVTNSFLALKRDRLPVHIIRVDLFNGIAESTVYVLKGP